MIYYFYVKNQYFCIFLEKILAKNSPKRTKLHHFLNFLSGACPRTPLANAWREAPFKYTHFSKKKNEPPPPPK